jgi:hypothetical protein
VVRASCITVTMSLGAKMNGRRHRCQVGINPSGGTSVFGSMPAR